MGERSGGGMRRLNSKTRSGVARAGRRRKRGIVERCASD